MTECWPKEARILRSKDFRRVQKHGQKWKSRDLLFLYLPNKENRTRIGLVVSKKVGNAVVRNRSKRILREVFRRRLNEYSGKQMDVVVIVFSSFVHKNVLQIERQCIKAMSSILKRR